MIKKLHFLTAVATASAIFAGTASAEAGRPYAGVQLGYGIGNSGAEDFAKNDGFNRPNPVGLNQKSSANNIAGRAYGGYMFTPSFGLEFGYSKFSNQTATVLGAGLGGNQNKRTFKSSVSAFDLVVVGAVPVQNWTLTAKAGVAYMMTDFANLVEKPSDYTVGLNTAMTNFTPRVGVGSDYNFTDNITVGAAYDFFFGRGSPPLTSGFGDDQDLPNDSAYSPSLSLFSANLKYFF